MPFEPAAPVERKPRVITGRFVLIAFITFFGTIALVNGIMMTLAYKTMPGLEVRNSYDASQGYNGELAAMREQAARGWKADIVLKLAKGAAPVSVEIKDGSGAAVTGLDLSARLSHPASRQGDLAVDLTETAPGRYAAAFTDVSRGAWDLVIEARRGDVRQYTSRGRVFLTE